jgi:prepilin-type N-terminal cleavage/methylation domain-containing protein
MELHGRPDASCGVVARAVRDRCDVFRGRALVTTPDTRHNSMREPLLPDSTVRERGLLTEAGMDVRRPRANAFARARSAQGFSLIELLIVVAIGAVLAGVAIGVTPNVINVAKGQSGAQQVAAFLKRHREMAISRRRNIEIAFVAPNRLTSIQRAASDPPNPLGPSTPLETVTLEGRLEFRTFAGVPDTPDAFGNAAAVVLGGANPVMFTSEGAFTDVDGNPINASVFLGVPNLVSTANALTIIGTTATVRTFRWDGSRWVQ